MERSKKSEMTRKEKTPERDEDQENRLKYLGDVALQLDELMKANNTFVPGNTTRNVPH